MPSQTTNQPIIGDDFIIRSTKPGPQFSAISIAEMLSESIKSFPQEQNAFIDYAKDTTLTYGELDRQARLFATGLLELGATKGDFVTYLAENSIQHVIAFLGAIYLGVPLGITRPGCGPFELTEQMEKSSTTILVFGADKRDRLEKALANPKYAQKLTQLKVAIQLDGDQENNNDEELLELAESISQISETKVRSFKELQQIGSKIQQQLSAELPHFKFANLESDPYFLSYTSGTTGTPKAAVQSNRSFAYSMLNFRIMKGTSTPGEHMIMWHPMGHISGSYFIHIALYDGATVVLFRTSDLELLLSAVEKHQVKNFTMAPGHATDLVNVDYEKRFDLSSLKVINHGGSKVPQNLLLKIRAKYNLATLNMYGATEFLGGVGHRDMIAAMQSQDTENVGTVLPGAEMKIIDLATGKALHAFGQGEICMRGPSCFVGYLNNEKATRETIDQEGWYHSGDIGYYNEQGDLYITDRLKEMIKFRFTSVTPAEIEDFLYCHPAVQAVCVVGVPHKTDFTWPRAYVQLVEGKLATEQELIDLVKDNMGFQNQLRAGVIFVTDMPRTVIDKVDRQHFKRLVSTELITQVDA